MQWLLIIEYQLRACQQVRCVQDDLSILNMLISSIFNLAIHGGSKLEVTLAVWPYA